MQARNRTRMLPLVPRLTTGPDGCVRRRWDDQHALVRQQLEMLETLELIRAQRGHRQAWRSIES